MPSCAVLYYTELYCTVLYCTVLYCTVLYCTVLYCTALYCTVLPSVPFLSCCIQFNKVIRGHRIDSMAHPIIIVERLYTFTGFVSLRVCGILIISVNRITHYMLLIQVVCVSVCTCACTCTFYRSTRK